MICRDRRSQSFIAAAAQQPPLTRARVTRILRQAHPNPRVIEKISSPAETVLPWWQYRANFVTPSGWTDGVRFWLAHRKLLESVAQTQGVAPEYIVAILGCETGYGNITGKDRVLDTLATLAFDYPQRAEFFRGELLQFLLLSHEAHLNPLIVKGSYTGAMGAPQFMPSSYRRYGVDADANSHVDLWNDWQDIFASIAQSAQTKRLAHWRSRAGRGAAGAGRGTAGGAAHARSDADPGWVEGAGLERAKRPARTTPAVLIAAEQAAGPAFGWVSIISM